MKRTSFGVFAVFGVFLLLAIVVSGQIATSEGPSVSSVFTGSVQVDKAGYFEVNDMARIDIDHYVGMSGQDLLLDVTNKLPYVGIDTTFTFAVQLDDLNLVSFARGTDGLVSKSVFNYTTTEISNKNGTVEFVTGRVNESSVLVPGTVWSEVAYRVFEWDSRTWAGTDVSLGASEVLPFKVVLKTRNFGERVKYSYLMNASGNYVEFDPTLDDSLVSYWDMSGVSNKTTDIYGNYDGAIGLNTRRGTQTALNGNYLYRLVAQDEPILTIKDEAFDAIGAAGGESWTLSFWMNTTDLAGGNPGDYIVNKECSGTGCTQGSPFSMQTGNLTSTGASGDLIIRGFGGGRNTLNITGKTAQQGWHNIILTSNSSGFTFFLDGERHGASPLGSGGSVISNAQNMTFGCNFGSNTSTCSASFAITNMFLDEISFWGRSFDQSDASNLYYNGTNGTFCIGDPCSFGGGPTNANETEGDNAIEVAINSSVPSATKYKTRQVYVVNSTTSQQKGTVDYLVVQNSPQRRWLLNYITTGESYLNAQNLSGTVYVLEIADKTAAQITQEVSAFINSTKN